MIGMLIGSYSWGYLGDTKSRMWAFKRTVAFTTLGAVFTSVSINYFMMLVGLFVVGLGVGGEITMGGPVMSEYLPPSKAYVYTVLCTTWTLGGVISGLVALIVKLAGSGSLELWRVCCIISTLIEIVFWVIRLPLKETPKFLVEKK